MKNYQRSYLARNRRAIVCGIISLSLAVAVFAGWGSIRQFGLKMVGKSAGSYDKDLAENGERREADGPDGRANWFMFQRMYPFGQVPDGGRRRAWDAVAARGQGFGPTGAANTWTSIGPMPTAGAGPGGAVSGRVNEIAVKPDDAQIILVAGSTGGIWRSTNGGTTFAPVTDSLVDLAVGAIAFAPSNPSIVYAGLGDTDNGYFGTGVLKSSDAGASWTRVSDASIPAQIRTTSIKVDPADPNKVYLAVSQYLDPAQCTSESDRRNCGVNAGVYISTNGGVAWTRTLTGTARSLAIHPTNSQIVYATVGFGADAAAPRGLYKSTDGGTTWNIALASPYTTSADSTKEFLVAVTPAAADRVYAYFAGGSPVQLQVQMSADAGATWTTRPPVVATGVGLDPGQVGYNSYLVASPVNADAIWVGCRDFFKSVDAGLNFSNQNGSFQPPYPDGPFSEGQQKVHTDQQAFAFLPGTETTFFVGNDGGIFKTADGGATFTSLNATLSLTQFIGLALHPTNGGITYAGAQDNGSQRRTTGTSGWVEFTATGDGGRVAINPPDPTIAYLSSTNGGILRNTETGTPGSAVSVASAASYGEGGNPRIQFYAPLATNRVDSKLYTATWKLFTCSDCSTSAGDGTWTQTSATDLTSGGTDSVATIAVAKSNNQVIYTGSAAGRAMRSQDGGATWTNITAGLPDRSITNISVSTTDPTLVYLTVSGYGSGHVWKSVDSGTTWTNASTGLPDIPTSASLIDPTTPTTVYAGTDIGVFRSTDSGGNWSVFNTGLPPVPITEFSAQATGKIQISTYGRGVYELGPGTTTNRKSRADFDGDGKTDISVFRPSEGTWYLNGSTAGFSAVKWGVDGDIPVPGDFDGDGKADLAVWRPSDVANDPDFYVLTSGTFVFTGYSYGSTGDIPVSGDFDGDGKSDIAVFRPSIGTWFLFESSTQLSRAVPFGSPGDIPVPMDSDGDGKTNLTVFRPSDHFWYIARATGTPAQNFDAIPFGLPTDILVPADYDGDGKEDVAVFRPSDGIWYILRSSDGGVTYTHFGSNGDIPVPGDYDGDGKTDTAVFRPSTGEWFLNRSTSGFAAQQFGVSTDRPIPAAYRP
ncbi:MAG: FG-GAP-like repeat-containing protein [Acidobacteriota bacterium]